MFRNTLQAARARSEDGDRGNRRFSELLRHRGTANRGPARRYGSEDEGVYDQRAGRLDVPLRAACRPSKRRYRTSAPPGPRADFATLRTPSTVWRGGRRRRGRRVVSEGAGMPGSLGVPRSFPPQPLSKGCGKNSPNSSLLVKTGKTGVPSCSKITTSVRALRPSQIFTALMLSAR